MNYDIVCFSHLRWGGVYQRPQHLLSRLAHTRRVFFIEEPEYEDTGSPRLKAIPSGADNVFVFRPRMRAAYPFYVGEQLEALRALTHELLARERVLQSVVWLYTPMALPVAEQCAPAVRVFDCMDELSAFRFAPAELADRDRATMRRESSIHFATCHHREGIYNQSPGSRRTVASAETSSRNRSKSGQVPRALWHSTMLSRKKYSFTPVVWAMNTPSKMAVSTSHGAQARLRRDGNTKRGRGTNPTPRFLTITASVLLHR